MRVLQTIPSLHPSTGGPARSVPALCDALQRAGADVTLLTFRAAGAPMAEISGSFQVERFEPAFGSRQLPTRRYAAWLKQHLREFDVVHINSIWNPAGSVVARACRDAGKRYVISPRGMLQADALARHRTLKRVYWEVVERKTVRGASAVHFFTEAEKQDSGTLLPSSMRTFVVPNGIDLGLAATASPGAFRSAFPVLGDHRFLLFVGRLHWSKGLELQAEAFARFAEHNPDAMWVLVGPDAGEHEKISSYLRSRGLLDRMLWTGLLPRRQCLEAMADASVILLTSRHEAHSVAMNEALAVGVPLVITDSVGFGEVEERGAGLMVPAEAAAIADAVTALLQRPRETMAAAGRKLAADRFAWPQVAQATLQEYARVLGL